jgi:hypothetical protein
MSTERWLIVEGDGRLILHEENDGWSFLNRGAEAVERPITLELISTACCSKLKSETWRNENEQRTQVLDRGLPAYRRVATGAAGLCHAGEKSKPGETEMSKWTTYREPMVWDRRLGRKVPVRVDMWFDFDMIAAELGRKALANKSGRTQEYPRLYADFVSSHRIVRR